MSTEIKCDFHTQIWPLDVLLCSGNTGLVSSRPIWLILEWHFQSLTQVLLRRCPVTTREKERGYKRKGEEKKSSSLRKDLPTFTIVCLFYFIYFVTFWNLVTI